MKYLSGLATLLLLVPSIAVTSKPKDEIVIDSALAEYKSKIDNQVTSVLVLVHNDTFQAKCDTNTKKISISYKYWNNLDTTAKKVTILRELLHCEKGFPYMVGISIMNKKITQAVNAYKYGAN